MGLVHYKGAHHLGGRQRRPPASEVHSPGLAREREAVPAAYVVGGLVTRVPASPRTAQPSTAGALGIREGGGRGRSRQSPPRETLAQGAFQPRWLQPRPAGETEAQPRGPPASPPPSRAPESPPCPGHPPFQHSGGLTHQKDAPEPPHPGLPAASARLRSPSAPAATPQRVGSQRGAGPPEPGAPGPRRVAVAEAGARATGPRAWRVVQTRADKRARATLVGPWLRASEPAEGRRSGRQPPPPRLFHFPFLSVNRKNCGEAGAPALGNSVLPHFAPPLHPPPFAFGVSGRSWRRHGGGASAAQGGARAERRPAGPERSPDPGTPRSLTLDLGTKTPGGGGRPNGGVGKNNRAFAPLPCPRRKSVFPNARAPSLLLRCPSPGGPPRPSLALPEPRRTEAPPAVSALLQEAQCLPYANGS